MYEPLDNKILVSVLVLNLLSGCLPESKYVVDPQSGSTIPLPNYTDYITKRSNIGIRLDILERYKGEIQISAEVKRELENLQQHYAIQAKELCEKAGTFISLGEGQQYFCRDERLSNSAIQLETLNRILAGIRSAEDANRESQRIRDLLNDYFDRFLTQLDRPCSSAPKPLTLNVLIQTSGERIVEVTTRSSKNETTTTFTYEQGSIVGQVGALDIGADRLLESTLEARFVGSITNLWNRSIVITRIEVVSTRTGEVFSGFNFDSKQDAIRPNDRYEFSGAGRVSNAFFNRVIRPFDLSFRVTTNTGSIVLPSEVYNLDTKAAVASKLLTTNRIKFGDKEGTILILNCEKTARVRLCERLLGQLAIE